jgi:N-6 DNA Methylase
MKGKRQFPLPAALQKLAGMIERLGDRHDPQQVFFDFCEMAACALSNKVDLARYEVREQRYRAIIGTYTELEDRLVFPAMLAELVIALERTEQDVLGPISACLGMTNFRRGQFWTPWEVSLLMARLTLAGNGGGDNADIAETIGEHGFITAAEPCCGPGGMVLAFARAFKEEGYNPQTQLHFVAVDTSAWCCHMAYVQLSLMGIPAMIAVGDALRMQFSEYWYTPAHILGGFSRRLRQRGIDEKNAAWWGQASVPERIRLLKASGLTVRHSLGDTPARAVLDAVQDASLKKPA